MIIEWIAENSIRNYPFTDHTDTRPLATNVFVDALIVPLNSNIRSVVLNSYFSDGSTVIIGITFNLFSGFSHPLDVLTFASVVPGQLYTHSSSNCLFKVIFGAGISTPIATISGLSVPFCPTVLLPYTPRVSQIAVTTVNGDTTIPAFTSTANLHVGSNILFENPSFLSVYPGAGTGLYDGCNHYDTAIKTINKLGPASGNFTVGGDSCYVKTYSPTHSLTVTNICSSPCPSEYFDAIAHYTNRVVDGASSLLTNNGTIESAGIYGINTLTSNLATLMSCYTTHASGVPDVVCMVTGVASPILNGNYWSFLITAYNTTESTINIRIGITTSGSCGYPNDYPPAFSSLPIAAHSEAVFNVTIKSISASAPTATFTIQNSAATVTYYTNVFNLS